MTESEFRAMLEAAAKVCDEYSHMGVRARRKETGAKLAAERIRALTPEQAGITLTEGPLTDGEVVKNDPLTVKIGDVVVGARCLWNGEQCPDRRNCFINGCESFKKSSVNIPARFK